MKVFLLLAVAVTVRATVIRYAPAVAETGASAQFRSEDDLGNYNFGYNEDHTSGGSFRREAGDAHGNVAGSYGLRDADGRLRIVNYVADDAGFRADIKTNEPGVEPKDPADVSINKDAVVVETAPAPIALSAPAALVAPAVAVAPAPLLSSAPIGKSITTTTYSAGPAAIAVPVPAASVGKSITTTTYAAAPAAIAVAAPAPVGKSITTYSAAPAAVFPPAPVVAPVSSKFVTTYSAPAPIAVAEPVAVKSALTFPPPAVEPVIKSYSAPIAAVAAPAPIALAEPLAYTSHVAIPAAEPAPVAIAAPAPLAYAGPAPAPLAYAGPAPAPLAYAGPAIATSKVAIAGPVAGLPYSPFAIPSSHIAVQGPVVNSYGYTTSHVNHSPLYYSLPSPVVSFAGPIPQFGGIHYIKKK